MPVPRKVLALAAGATLALSASTLSTTLAQQPSPRGEVVEVPDATVEWIEKSQVAAQIEGNLESLELDIGKPVKKGGVIGYLFREKAKLTVAKAELAKNNVAEVQKAEAQRDQAISVVARNRRMIARDPLLVPKEDQEKAEADFKVANAMIRAAQENHALAEAEYNLAVDALEDHTIKAPFSGLIIKRLKHVGESVSAREAVVEMGNLDKLRVFAYLTPEVAYRVTEGTVVEFQPRISRGRGGSLPVERKKYQGAITFIDPTIQPIAGEEVRVYADFKNEAHELMPGMKGTLTIDLGTAAPAAATRAEPASPDAVVPASTSAAPAGAELPPLPR